MIYRTIGKSNLKASILGYGAWALGGDGWNDTNSKEAIATLELAYEKGINFFDTAPIYGKGKSEEIIGNIFQDERDKILIATKCGLLWDNQGNVKKDVSRDAIMFDIDNSLKRLKTNYIDLYQIHWPDNKTSFAETFATLNQLQNEGTIREIGVSNFDLPSLEKALKIAKVVSVQNQYNMLQTKDEKDILPYCLENKIGYIPYSPLAQGLLSGKFDENYNIPSHNIREFNPLFADHEKFEEALRFVATLKKPVAHTAIKFILQREEIPTLIASVTKRNHLEANLQAIEMFEK